MAKKKVNLNAVVEKWLQEQLPKMSNEQVKELYEHPEVMVEAVLQGVKQACERNGIDYTTTPIYQEELKFRQQQEDDKASRERWEHLNTPEGIDLFDMAFHLIQFL